MKVAISFIPIGEEIGGAAEIVSLQPIDNDYMSIERYAVQLDDQNQIAVTAGYRVSKRALSVHLEHNGRHVFTAGCGYIDTRVCFLLELTNGIFVNFLFFRE